MTTQTQQTTASTPPSEKVTRRQEKEIEAKKARAWLIERFPAVFTEQGEIHPLAIGTFEQVVKIAKEEEGPPKKDLREAIRFWTHWPKYLRAIANGKVRRNLDGSESEPVKPSEQEYAQTLLDKHNQRVRARKQREQEEKHQARKAKAAEQQQQQQLATEKQQSTPPEPAQAKTSVLPTSTAPNKTTAADPQPAVPSPKSLWGGKLSLKKKRVGE